MSEPARTSAAIASSAALPALIMVLWSPDYYGAPGVLLLIFVVSYVVAVVANIVLGLPLLVLGLRIKMAAWWSAAIAGFVVGVIVDLTIRVGSFYSSLPEIAAVGAMGSATGLAFWWAWQLAGASSRRV